MQTHTSVNLVLLVRIHDGVSLPVKDGELIADCLPKAR